jgi:hypothetical protein
VVSFGWHHDIKGVRFAHGVTLGPNVSTETSEKHILMRALCHFFVDVIPEEGVEELADSALDLLKFYTAPATTSLLGAPQGTVQANIVNAYERPVLDIAEE